MENFIPSLTLSSPIGNHHLVAKYDLVAVQDNKALIYDWKTYVKRPRGMDVGTLATRVYRALLVQAGEHLNSGKPFEPEQVEMIYWYADFPSEPTSFKSDANQFNAMGRRLKKSLKKFQTPGNFR